jgi:hypothetical protein
LQRSMEKSHPRDFYTGSLTTPAYEGRRHTEKISEPRLVAEERCT